MQSNQGQTEVGRHSLTPLLNRSRLSRWLGYSVAVLSPFAGLLLVWSLEHGGRLVPLYPIFTVAVILSALFGGLLPGLISVGLSLLYIHVFLAARYLPLVGQRSALLFSVLFGLVGAFLSMVIGMLRSSQQAFLESSNRYRSLFESIDEGFCVIEVSFDENGSPNDWRFLETNPAFERQNGLHSALGKTIRELVPNIETRWFQIYGRVALTGEAIRFIEFSQALNRWFDLYAFRVGGPEQHRVAVLFNDITEKKRAEEALIRSEKLASVGRMASTMAHEINNPLAAIVNELFIAQTNAESPETVRRCLEVADGELRRVIQIARQSLGFYRESTNSAQVVVTDVMDSTIDLLKNKIKAKHITVGKRYASHPLTIGVTGELRQIFANLLANGIDAVDDKGTISVRVRNGSLNQNGKGCVRITIADNGEGIPNSAVAHIFEPFFTTKESVGTGLGLWVTKQLVEKHGGSIRLRSRTNGLRRGTMFSIVLPAADAHSDAELTLEQRKKSA